MRHFDAKVKSEGNKSMKMEILTLRTSLLFGKTKTTWTFFTFLAFITLTLFVGTGLSPSVISIRGFLSFFLEAHTDCPGRTFFGVFPLFVEEVLMFRVGISAGFLIPSVS